MPCTAVQVWYHMASDRTASLITQIPDGMGAGAVIRHHNTVDVWHGAQPYLSFIVEGHGCVISKAIDNMFVNL